MQSSRRNELEDKYIDPLKQAGWTIEDVYEHDDSVTINVESDDYLMTIVVDGEVWVCSYYEDGAGNDHELVIELDEFNPHFTPDDAANLDWDLADDELLV